MGANCDCFPWCEYLRDVRLTTTEQVEKMAKLMSENPLPWGNHHLFEKEKDND